MSKRIFPKFVYTREFASVLFVAMLWLGFKSLDVFHGLARLPFVMFTTLGAVFLGRELLRGKDFLNDDPPPPRAHPPPYSAYLVIHFDIRESPPVAKFVGIYSSSAQDLTSIGGEAHADIYVVHAGSYHEASEHLARVAPLYFPWVVPLMTRCPQPAPSCADCGGEGCMFCGGK